MKYPAYRACQWIDTSPEAMEREQATILYGIETKREQGGRWMKVSAGAEPLLFSTAEQASEVIKGMRLADKATTDN